MAKQSTPRRAPAKTGIDAHDVFLAGLGAVSLTRKQGIKLYGVLLDEGKQFQGRVEQTLDSLQDQARLGAEIVRERVEAIVLPLRERAGATLGTVKDEIETRLAPVFEKLGVKRAAKPRTRSTAKRTQAKKAPVKRAVRKRRAA